MQGRQELMDALCQSLIELAKSWETEFNRDGSFAEGQCANQLREVLDKHKVGGWS